MRGTEDEACPGFALRTKNAVLGAQYEGARRPWQSTSHGWRRLVTAHARSGHELHSLFEAEERASGVDLLYGRHTAAAKRTP
jgi:hypothetical protein